MAFREARPFLLVLGVISLLCLWISPWLALMPGAAFAYVLWFFRDPERPIPPDPLDIVSAADGRVIAVDTVEEPWHVHAPMKRVAVFLSVFNVHVNRAPAAGRVAKIHHHAGEFLDARHPEVDVRNEAMNWLLETPHGPLVLRQIAGLIARRIVAWSSEGENLEKGQRFGMIRFGSRTDVYLPLDCEVLVQPGQKVRGGSSVIARWPQR